MADGSKLDKTFDPSAIETRLYKAWENDGCFKAGRALEKNPEAEPYTIVIPPPNVTGSLHMGHALNNTLQDILCRFERMRGRDVLWQPGTDHAGIATQMVVERQLAAQGNESRRDMGREKFLERVWQWKDESGSTITCQLRRLGASCDWSRERFTMDEGLSKAVRKVFVTLYEQELIYKDKRLVNWDPGLLTAISDLEVEQRETNSHLWHFNYPLEDGSGHITVATTRPETMLGDTGVAVHPDDERYQKLIGKNVVLPIVGRLIPIVADDYADSEKGSGAVKITPAHDFNDFEVGKRCGLAAINMLDQHAAIDLSDEAFAEMDGKDEWHGLDRYEARKKIVATLEEMGLVDKIEPDTHMVPYGDRSNQVIEPWLTDQWYVDAETMAKPAIEAVKNGDTKFVPPNWDKTYFEWMNNIQPWCISRQLWWGHQIPAWYDEDGKVYVAESEAAAQAQAGEGVALTRDEDVLDTWFSSALWPFSTLGWTGDEKKDPIGFIKRHYKTDVLVTGFDIIFFWVARMMMMGLHFMKDEKGKPEVPFDTVYVHALVRDEKGAKMSKSKGNVVDPLEIMDKYGTDALRFTLSSMAAMGRDIKLSESRVEGYRNFATKLWNAARFCEMNDCFEAGDFDPSQASQPLTQWLVGEVVRAQNAVTKSLEAYRFNDASNAVYQFIWNSFCDWYVEFAKPALQGAELGVGDTLRKDEVRAATKWAFEQALRLLHPFMPFVTEEVWSKTGYRANHLMLDVWPDWPDSLINESADFEIEWLIDAIRRVRSARLEVNVPASAILEADLSFPVQIVKDGDDGKTGEASQQMNWARFKAHKSSFDRMARVVSARSGLDHAEGTIGVICKTGTSIRLHVADVIDIDAEKARLKKDIGKVEGEIKKISGKLNNQGFLDKAPQAVVDENKARLAEEEARRDKLQSALERLG